MLAPQLPVAAAAAAQLLLVQRLLQALLTLLHAEGDTDECGNGIDYRDREQWQY